MSCVSVATKIAIFVSLLQHMQISGVKSRTNQQPVSEKKNSELLLGSLQASAHVFFANFLKKNRG